MTAAVGIPPVTASVYDPSFWYYDATNGVHCNNQYTYFGFANKTHAFNLVPTNTGFQCYQSRNFNFDWLNIAFSNLTRSGSSKVKHAEFSKSQIDNIAAANSIPKRLAPIDELLFQLQFQDLTREYIGLITDISAPGLDVSGCNNFLIGLGTKFSAYALAQYGLYIPVQFNAAEYSPFLSGIGLGNQNILPGPFNFNSWSPLNRTDMANNCLNVVNTFCTPGNILDYCTDFYNLNTIIAK